MGEKKKQQKRTAAQILLKISLEKTNSQNATVIKYILKL